MIDAREIHQALILVPNAKDSDLMRADSYYSFATNQAVITTFNCCLAELAGCVGKCYSLDNPVHITDIFIKGVDYSDPHLFDEKNIRELMNSKVFLQIFMVNQTIEVQRKVCDHVRSIGLQNCVFHLDIISQVSNPFLR